MLTITQLPLLNAHTNNIKRFNNNYDKIATSIPQNINLNHLNAANKSLIKFTGYHADFDNTLKQNYFNLPIDNKTGEPYKPDIYQTAAAENLYKGNDVVVAAPTGTGKTAIAHYIISKNLKEGKKTFYTAPLKALSNDKVREFEKIYGKENIGLLTGDRKINSNAPIVIMTTEVYRNMLLQNNMNKSNPILKDLKTVIFDELHYLNDEDRGGVWEQSILFTKPKTQILALSATMKNADDVTDWISATKNYGIAEKVRPDNTYRAKNTDKLHTVLIDVPPENRHVPLHFEVIKSVNKQSNTSKINKHIKPSNINPLKVVPTNEDYISLVGKLQKQERVPAIFFVFSKRKSKELLTEMKMNGPVLTTKEERNEIIKIIDDYKKQGKYLGELLDQEALIYGYAIHNAGMLPEQKELVETLFQKKLVKVAIATETLSAGINMPAKTTVISAAMKPVSNRLNPDGKRELLPNEFQQMAGRAGRRGIDEEGFVYCMACNNAQEKFFNKIITEKANDIKSHLKTDYSFVANIDKNFDDKEFLSDFYLKSFFAFDKDENKRKAKANYLTKEFYKKEQILKNGGFITKDNNLTEKGEFLSMLNGYEQIPVIDAICNKDLKGLNPQQLAGYVAGLATMSQEEPRNQYDSMFSFDDDVMDGKCFDLERQVYDYNTFVYSKLDQEVFLNTDAMKHVYTWADRNDMNEDSTKTWHSLFKGEDCFNTKDEGNVFKEIVMTADLLKQIKDITEYAQENSVNPSDKLYYKNLNKTTEQAIDLINRKPAKQDE